MNEMVFFEVKYLRRFLTKKRKQGDDLKKREISLANHQGWTAAAKVSLCNDKSSPRKVAYV
jgi:hypothetical protein